VTPPPLDSKNRYEGLSVETGMDTDDSATVASDSSSATIGRGSQETELGAPEACLIPGPNEKPVETKPKEGVTERYFIRSTRLEREVMIDAKLTTLDTHDTISVKSLLDSGATGLFIDREFVHKNGLTTRALPYPIKVYNIDGTLNQGGSITEEITLMMSYKGHKERAVFEVCDLGKATVIIGHPWLRKHNPDIDWRTGEVRMTRCPHECNVFIRATKKEK